MTGELAEQIDLGFSTADAELVELRYSHGDLLLYFTDWKEQKRTVRFIDTAAYSWQPTEFLEASDQRDDTVYRINNSSWANALPAEQKKHLRLWFNACGVLDVVCQSCREET